MRIATWNVNSVKQRVPRLLPWLDERRPDVVCLQETKLTDDAFADLLGEALTERGYAFASNGQGQWNGVALLSKVGLDDVQRGFADMPGFPDAEARAISATCAGLRVHSLYVPNGRTLEDPHLPYKLKWLSALRDTATGWLADDPSLPLALMGDWNIAPTDEDVWDMAVFANSTHVSEPERAAFRAINDAGFADVVRPFTPGPGVYTYWDYTQLRFPKKQGMRIDFVLGSPEFAARVTHGEIVREERKGKQPSDHAPVLVELAP